MLGLSDRGVSGAVQRLTEPLGLAEGKAPSVGPRKIRRSDASDHGDPPEIALIDLLAGIRLPEADPL